MEIGLVQKINIDSEMQQAYLDYAMSVIVARALPDARDGLKPVHRRILFAMEELGVRANTTYKKSARIVGEVLGKFHPHGEAAVYDALARMAQDFSMRYLLVDGQGNFGSVDGDPPAAMRYTEARLAAAASEMLADIQKDTVNFVANFDESLKEPVVLPAALPNLLVNGATGIAVGMATNIPPHNLCEVVDALRYMLMKWERLEDVTVEDLMGFIQGPDFPTGGVILQETGEEGLAGAYGSGRGRITVQARAHIEDMERGKSRIIVTELPYMTNKSALIERIAELAREERLEGIADLRDESDRQGMRIVIELTKNADPRKALGCLFKHTPMQTTFGIILLALVDGEPRMLSLKQALRVYLDHRLEIVRRRSEHDLAKARQRAHILEGLLIALKNLDEIIELIRKAPDADTAKARLIKRFKLSDVQAQAILDMQLRRLAGLERRKIEEEYRQLSDLIKQLTALLASPKKMRQVISEELEKAKETYGDRRRTQIVGVSDRKAGGPLLNAVDLLPEHTSWIMVTADGLVWRSHQTQPPALDGADRPQWVVEASGRDLLYLVNDQGEAAAVPVHVVPEAERPSGGAPLHKVSALKEGSRLAAAFTLPARERPENCYILTASRQGLIKKSAAADLPGPSATSFTLAKVNPGDSLGWCLATDGQAELLLVTEHGMAIRFSEEEVRPMGLVAAGVMGIKLGVGDQLAGLELVAPASEAVLVASNGLAKRVRLEEFPKQGRYGQGVVAWKLSDKAVLRAMAVGQAAHAAALIQPGGQALALRLGDIALQTRAGRGSIVKALAPGGVSGLVVGRWQAAAPPKAPEAKEEPVKGGVKSRAAAKPAAASKAPVKASGKSAAKTEPAKKPAGKTPTVKAEPAVKKAAPAKPAAKTTTAAPVKGAAVQKPAVQKPAVQKTAVQKPAVQKPAAKKPARPPTAQQLSLLDTPAAAPAAKKPAAKKPAARKPADKTPSVPKPAARKPAAKVPAAKTPAVQKPAVQKPAVQKPAVQKPAAGKKSSGK